MVLGMTDEDVVRKFHRIVGIGSVGGPYMKGQPHWKPSWRWTCGGHNHVQALLAAFFIFLGTRRQAKTLEVLLSCHGMRRNRHTKTLQAQCINGHEMTEANSYIKNNKRRCKRCRVATGIRRTMALDTYANLKLAIAKRPPSC
jgi:hypothetical protein